MNQADLREIEKDFDSVLWKAFSNWIKNVKIPALEAEADRDLSEHVTSILNREQMIGAKKQISYLVLDFQSHITTQINNEPT